MKRILTATVGLLLVASTAFAKDIGTGTIEIAGSSNGGFAFISGNGSSSTKLDLGLDGIYYLMPNFGVGGLFDITTYSGDDDSTTVTIGPEAIYNFSINERTNAYVGGMAAFRSADNGNHTASGLSAGANGGIKYFFTDVASLNCGLSVSHVFGDFDTTVIGVGFGISVFLK